MVPASRRLFIPFLERPMKTPLRPGETLVRQGGANLQRKLETVGGHLYLTNERLVFESHRFNIQQGPEELELAQVQSTEKAWTKFLNVIPLFPNSLAVTLREGAEFRFVVFGRGAWQQAIERTRPTAKA